MAQTPPNCDLKVWVEKELILFLIEQYGERVDHYGKSDWSTITDDANTMVETLKTIEDTERSNVRGTSFIKSERHKQSDVEDHVEDVIDTQPLSARSTSRARDTERLLVKRRCEEADWRTY
jgi:hypothetical protein